MYSVSTNPSRSERPPISLRFAVTMATTITTMSGMAATGHYDEKLRAHGVPLLAKPIMRDVLIHAVQSAFAAAPAA